MTGKLERGIGIVLTVFLLLIWLMMWKEHRPASMLGMIAAYTAFYVVHEFVPAVREWRKWRFFAYYTVQTMLAFGIVAMDGDFISQVFLLILVAEVSYYSSIAAGAVCTLICYSCFVAGHWMYYGYPPLSDISYVFPRFIEYAVFFGISSLARTARVQRQRLAAAYDRLEAASADLERQTLLQERTRISRELHDTMGHTLLSALTGVKAAQRFMADNPPLARDMLAQTQEQLKKGLEDVRHVVDAMQEEKSFPAFLPALRALARETERQMGVTVELQLPETLPPFAPKVEMTLYRALQEGLTNGVRHGKSTRFRFELSLSGNRIVFRLRNNGAPWRDRAFGFGLTSMQERVREVGGILSVGKGQDGAGTVIGIDIPFKS